MKKIYFLSFLFFSAIISAQVVNIPDANLKSKLIMANPVFQIAKDQLGNNIAIDTNSDGQIQVSEALTVYELNLSIFGASFTDMTGLLSFSNLKTLTISSNHITNLNLAGLDLENLSCDFCYLTTLDLTPFPHLKHLSCGSNSISSLNLSVVPLLETLTCRYNNLSSLNIQYVPNLNYLDCQNNQIPSLNLDATPNMTMLLCDGNHLTSLDLSNVVNLQMLGCGGNQITALNLSNVPNMENLSFSNCLVSSIDLSHMPNLKSLIFPYNSISSLDLSHSPNLITLWCFNNLLTSLDVDSNLNLEQLQCEVNQITTITFNNPHTHLAYLNFANNLMTSFNFSNAINSQGIVCNNNHLTTIDFSGMLGLNGFNCSGNNLTFLSIKNGRVESDIDFSNNPNLSFICADDSQVISIQNILNNLGMNNTVCNSYCTFLPGQSHNTITGEVVFDINNDGCDSSDPRFSLIKFKLYDQNNYLGATATNTLGMYTFFPPYYTTSISPDVENQQWYNFSPPSANFNFVSSNNTAIQNFCITANGVHPDLEIVIVPIIPSRPGFIAQYQIVYKNKGNQILSGDVTLNYDDNLVDFSTASVMPNSQSIGNIQWTFANLLPFQDRSFTVAFNVNSPTSTPPVSIGTLLHFSAVINPVSGDQMPTDNVAELNQIVVGSFDPNDKTCLEGTQVSSTKIGDYLHYNINFENTGTAAAENIVVKDLIDTTKFDIKTLQIMHASHDVMLRINNDNKVEFIFENINLGAGVHGNVVFKIKTKSNLNVGDTVSNGADIYFDYNAPVATNIASSSTFQTLGIAENHIDTSVVVFPNPASGSVNIKANDVIKSVQLFDVQGRILVTKIEDENQINIDVASYSNGIYFLKITTEKGCKTERFVKK